MQLFLPNSLTWSTAGSRYPGGETLPGHYYGDPLTQLAPGHCWPSPCQRQLDPCPYPSPTPALLPSKHPKAPTPVHPVSVRRALQPPGTLPSPGIASFPACPGRGARFLLLPLSLPAAGAQRSRPCRAGGRGCRHFLPQQPRSQGFLRFSCASLGAQGKMSLQQDREVPAPPAATSGRSVTSGLSRFSQFSTGVGSVCTGGGCWVGSDPSSAPFQSFPHFRSVSTCVSAQNASQEMALDCFCAQAEGRDGPCSQRLCQGTWK